MTNVFLASFSKHISGFSVFLAKRPVSWVDVSIFVSHNSFAVTLTVLPVSVVVTDSFVVLLADTRLNVIFPGAIVEVGW